MAHDHRLLRYALGPWLQLVAHREKNLAGHWLSILLFFSVFHKRYLLNVMQMPEDYIDQPRGWHFTGLHLLAKSMRISRVVDVEPLTLVIIPTW